MKILPTSPLGAYIAAIELDGVAINATYVDLETGRVQYWENGRQVEGQGEVKILLQAKQKPYSLNPAMDTELSALLEKAKQRMALMTPEERAKMFEEQKASFVRAMTTPCEHGVLDFETCPDCRAKYDEDQ